MSAPLHHACARTPVTACAFARSYILTAEGPFLRVFRKNGSGCLFADKIFKNQAIHGLVVVDDSHPDYSAVIAYGGHLVRFLRLSHDEVAHSFALDQAPAARVSDWVLDLAHPFQENPSSTVAVTAHNQLVRLSWTGSSPSACIPLTVCNLTVSSRCILYSAHISWLSAAKVLVASGTAFGEILVWSCDFNAPATPRSCVHHFFTGHEGSIFGVQISPPFSVAAHQTEPHQLLASCSDDRTVRIWDISQLPDGGDFSTSDDALGLVQDRETGFGANVNSDQQDDCLAVAWGHTSRVWAIRFVGFSRSHNPGVRRRFVSFGEDATSRVWDLDCKSARLDPLPRLTVSTKLLDTRAFHSGKNIWAMDLATSSPQQSAESFDICTGAADSAIVSHHWPLNPLESVSPQPTTDAHRCCSFVADRVVVSATNSGKIIRGREGDDSSFVWEAVGQVDDLKGYSVSIGLPECSLAFLAGSSGKIYAYQDSSRQCPVVAQLSRKTSGIFASYFQGADGAGFVSLIATTVGAKVAESFLFMWNHDALELQLRKKTVLELPHSFVVTSALYTLTAVQTMIFLGARNGSMAQFSDSKPEEDPESEPVKHSAIFELHAPETVTSLAWISHDSPTSDSHQLGHLISTGRNGHYAATEIHANKPAVIAHQISLPFGPNVEGCFVSKDTLIVYGFRGKHFVAIDASTEQEVFSVECGGAHRIWGFCPSPNTGQGGTFVWNQASTLKLHSTSGLLSHRVIRSGGHGREIKAAAACPADARILATGAEDTTIRILEYDDSSVQPDFKSVRVLRKHVTGIQHLAWSEDGRYLFSSGGYEEFFAWRVRRLPAVLGGLGVVCEAVCPPESELPDLRIMSFSVQQETPHADDDQMARFLVNLVYSDSTLRTYSYTAETKAFTLRHVGTYATSCLTQTTFLSSSTLLTASTDGHVAFWPLPPSSSPPTDDLPLPLTYTSRHRIHQNTIKALAHAPLSPRTSLLLTAADDNAIAFTLVHHSSPTIDGGAVPPPPQPRTSTLLIPRAHAATVTGAALLRAETDGEETRFWAVTSGSDQRVKVWDVGVEAGAIAVDGVRVGRVADEACAVADVADVVVLGEERERERGMRRTVVVVGVGMEAWGVGLG